MEAQDSEIEETMRRYYHSLSEKDRRRYAGLEALKYGRGGRSYIAKVLGCSRRTVSKGACEVSGLPKREVEDRIRKAGGGRKTYEQQWPEIDEPFLAVLRDHTAGDPMDEKVRWTDLTLSEIVIALQQDHAIWVSKWVVRQLLKKHNYRRRKAQKRGTFKSVPNRNAQFENIARLISAYQAAGNPIMSLDTKKKEHLGNFYRDGQLYTLEEIQAWDHDFTSQATGIIIPHTLYDVGLNIGYIQLGTSHDTSEFACDSFRLWWYTYGRNLYPQATSILVLCDGGGSNSSRHYIFKADDPVEMIIQQYHAHATSEQFHAEFKGEIDLERLPSGKFKTNQLVLHCALLAYNNLRLIGQFANASDHIPMRKSAQRRRLKTVIQNLMYLTSRVVRHARRR